MRILPLAACFAAFFSTPVAADEAPKIDRGNGMFFNRPGATLDQALADTGACRAIAEGAQSQITAVGVLTGGLGSVLGGAIAGGRLKRVNIENCMLVRGWRLFAMTRAEGGAWKALPEAERTALLTAMTGADVPARGTLLRVWHNDYAEPVLWQKTVIALLLIATATPAMAQLVEQVDLKKPERPVPAANEGMVVLRAHAPGMVGDNRILLHRIDPATARVVRGADGKAAGAKLTYSYSLFGGKKGEKALRVAILPAGDYVLAGRTFNLSFTDSFCFGAPRFTLAPGQIVYIGDYEMFALEKMPDGERRNAMRYSADLTDARSGFATAYPALAPALAEWTPTNGTVFDCDGDEFTAYAVPAASGGH